MTKRGLLKTYNEKRNFDATPEPSGKAISKKVQAATPKIKKLGFVVQKHDATRLHYDFRLEAEGVLKSWAVPKGPSTDPKDRRLAVMTENHPLAYAGFEGVIPEGEYGGGPVIVWDRGKYVNLTTHHGKIIPLTEGLKRGHVHFWLEGKKLHGAWSLVQLRRGEKNWLLIKSEDEGAHYPPDPVHDEVASVLSGRSIEEVASNRHSRVWHSNRAS